MTRHPLALLDLLIRVNTAAQNPGEEHEDLAERFVQIMADPATGEQLRALRAQAEAWGVVEAIATAEPPIGAQEARIFAQKALAQAGGAPTPAPQVCKFHGKSYCGPEDGFACMSPACFAVAQAGGEG